MRHHNSILLSNVIDLFCSTCWSQGVLVGSCWTWRDSNHPGVRRWSGVGAEASHNEGRPGRPFSVVKVRCWLGPGGTGSLFLTPVQYYIYTYIHICLFIYIYLYNCIHMYIDIYTHSILFIYIYTDAFMFSPSRRISLIDSIFWRYAEFTTP